MKAVLVKSGQNYKYISSVIILLLTIFIISIVILSSVPPVSKDALTHRLAFPKLYLKHGGSYESQVMHFSYYPMNLIPPIFNSRLFRYLCL